MFRVMRGLSSSATSLLPEVSDRRIVHCTCGTCLIPTASSRKSGRDTFDALTFPDFVIIKGTRHGARHGKSEAQREYHQARDCMKKAEKDNFDSIPQRFQQSETYRHSQMIIGRDEELCKRLDRVAREDQSYIATWDERRRHEKNWKLGLKPHGPVGPMKSRSDDSEAVEKIREIRRETDQEVDPAILPSQQVRQRPEQSLQKSETWTVDLRKGWISWSSSESASSSTTWWKPFTWWSSPNWEEHWARSSVFLIGFRLQAMAIPLQATWGVNTALRAFHTRKHFLACGSRFKHASFWCHFEKQSFPKSQIILHSQPSLHDCSGYGRAQEEARKVRCEEVEDECNPHPGGHFGRFAEQSLLACYQLNDPVEVSSKEVAPMLLPSRRASVGSTHDSCEDIPATPVSSEVDEKQKYGNVGFHCFSRRRERCKCRPTIKNWSLWQ